MVCRRHRELLSAQDRGSQTWCCWGREERGEGPASILRTATEDPNLQLWMSLALSSVQRRGEVGLGGSLQLVMLGELAGESWGASLERTCRLLRDLPSPCADKTPRSTWPSRSHYRSHCQAVHSSSTGPPPSLPLPDDLELHSL